MQHFYLTYCSDFRCYHIETAWTWEWGQWRHTPHSSKFHHYWSLDIRGFSVVGSYLFTEMQSVSSTAPALSCWMLSKAVSSTIFLVFGITWPEIEPCSPEPLPNSLHIWPMACKIIYKDVYKTHTHTHTHTHIYIYIHTNTCLYLMRALHTHTHTYIYIHIAYIHGQIPILTYTQEKHCNIHTHMII